MRAAVAGRGSQKEIPVDTEEKNEEEEEDSSQHDAAEVPAGAEASGENNSKHREMLFDTT